MRKLDKHYVSDIDKFIQAFNTRHPIQSASQKAEIKKHQRIFALRDKATLEQDIDKIWNDF